MLGRLYLRGGRGTDAVEELKIALWSEATVAAHLALAEAYPDLKAAESFLTLQRNLSEIEDQIQNARRYYNAVVGDLKTRIAQFPFNLIAGAFGFRSREFFGIADSGERAVPGIDLGSRQ